MTAERLPTGVKRLDALLGGGIPAGSAVLVYGPPFLGKETFARRFLLASLAQGIPAIDIVTNVATADVRQNLGEADPSYPKYEQAHLIRFVDTYSQSIGAAGVMLATPMLTVVTSGCSDHCSTFSRMVSATANASTAESPGNSTANSSPP